MESTNHSMMLTTAAVICTAVTFYKLGQQAQPLVENRVPKSDNKNEFPQDIKDELFSRIESFFGIEGLTKLKNSFVVVILI
jgi:hypothetical protein